MINVVHILLFLVFFQPVENSLLWSENDRLDWTDFKGVPDVNIDAAALTASGITLELSAKTTKTSLIEYNALVEARFYPDQSWYKREFANSFVLAHEQLHFDITELYARKLRQAIQQAALTINIKKEIFRLNKIINKELKERQQHYDRDSNFSRNRETQRNWQSMIYNELKKLSKYK